jgi:murein L,D-transpeptidase YafK
MRNRNFYQVRVKADFTLLTLIAFLIVHCPTPSTAGTIMQSRDRPELVPASLLKWPEQGSNYAILVDMSAQRVFLYERDNLFRPLKVYRCSTGENGGPKVRENDRKTPVGIYFFTNSYVKRELSPIYGVRAFAMDYPNPLDRKERRGGYGIWFHGTNKPLKPRDTNGCIVLNNRDIDELASYIELNDTPVIISSKIEMVNQKKLQEEAIKLEKIIENWREAWGAKKIDGFMSHYGRQFTSKSKNWQQWRAYKARLARKYPRIMVEIDNLRLIENDGTVLAVFNQSYSAEGYESLGQKRLYLRQNSSQWKIVGEFFTESKGETLASKRAWLASQEDIKRFITSWKKAWEQENLNAYISCYDSTFRSRDMDLAAWKEHRKRLNRKIRSLRVVVKDLKIKRVSSQTAVASFKQDYRADRYQDFGLKEVLLIKRGERWKIKKEEWKPLSSK